MTGSGEPRVARWLLALLSGALLALSFPGSGDQGWAAFAALVPLLAAVDGAGWRRVVVLGFGAGIVFWAATIAAPDGRIAEASGLFTREIVSGTIAPRIGRSGVYPRYGDVFAWTTVAVALAMMWPTGLARKIGTRRIGETQVALGDETGRLHVRRGALTGLLVTAAGAIAAAVWRWRPPAAGGEGYQVVARWTIPGGEGRFVVQGPDPGAKDLYALVERIREDFARHENGVAMIFDDVQAACDVRRGSRHLGEERFRAALRHQRAMYLKRAARGEESFVVYTDYPLVRETFRYLIGRHGTAP